MTANIANIYSSCDGGDVDGGNVDGGNFDDVDDIIESVLTNVQTETSKIDTTDQQTSTINNIVVDYREEYFRLLNEIKQKDIKITQLKNTVNEHEKEREKFVELAENNRSNRIHISRLGKNYSKLQEEYSTMQKLFETTRRIFDDAKK